MSKLLPLLRKGLLGSNRGLPTSFMQCGSVELPPECMGPAFRALWYRRWLSTKYYTAVAVWLSSALHAGRYTVDIQGRPFFFYSWPCTPTDRVRASKQIHFEFKRTGILRIRVKYDTITGGRQRRLAFSATLDENAFLGFSLFHNALM